MRIPSDRLIRSRHIDSEYRENLTVWSIYATDDDNPTFSGMPIDKSSTDHRIQGNDCSIRRIP
jgi:hypothetical protein